MKQIWLSSIISVLFGSIGCQEVSTNRALPQTANRSTSSKNDGSSFPLRDARFDNGAWIVSNNDTSMHFFLWTGWIKANQISQYKDSIHKWVASHPDARVYPIFKLNDEPVFPDQKPTQWYFSLVIDPASQDTLQTTAVAKGYVYVGHFFPIMNEGFHTDHCFGDSTLMLVGDCEMYRRYLNGLEKAHDRALKMKVGIWKSNH